MSESDRFEGRTVAVTGAGGFIGAAVCEQLSRSGATVRGLEIDPLACERVADRGGDPVQVDVLDRAALEAALSGCEAVVHTAAFVHDWGTMREFIDLNVGGTVNVLDAARAAAAERVIHLSSVVVYGYVDRSDQTEAAPRRVYGIPYLDTKSASDRVAARAGAVVIRPGDVYGPGSVPWCVRPLELARAGRLAVPSPGEGIMLPVHVDDLADAVLLALERGTGGEAYAVWSGERLTFREYFDRLAAIVGAECRVLPRSVMVAAAGALGTLARLQGRPPELTTRALTFVSRRGTVSTSRAREELGWEPAVGIDEGIAGVAAWAREAADD